MEMRQEFRPEIDLLIEQLQFNITRLDHDVDVLKRQVQGGEDPTRGLLVLNADITKTVSALASAVAEIQRDVHEHRKQPHLSLTQMFWRDIGKSVISSLVAVITVAMLGWMAYGARAQLLVAP